MPDSEKALNALDEILKITRGMSMGAYLYVAELATDIRSALAMLKEQEPRVLTLEEARTYEVVWPEDKGEGVLHPLIVHNNMNDSKYYKYGIHWRVWSAKPADEQRKAVQWDDD